MVTTVNIVFPHQLFEHSPLLSNVFPVYLVEEYLFFKQYNFHQQKLAFHRASMKHYEHFLKQRGKEVVYIDAQQPWAEVRQLLKYLSEQGVDTIHYIEPSDNWLEKRLMQTATEQQLVVHVYSSLLFLNTKEDLVPFFKNKKKKFFQTEFYIKERKKRGILTNEKGQAIGGKWSFDAENRKKYPRKKIPPKINFPPTSTFYRAAKKYVAQHFSKNTGLLTPAPLYPTNFQEAQQWLQEFLERRLLEFGAYEDAIVHQAGILHHSVLTPMLNVGLLTPKQVLKATLDYATKHEIPMNSLEGFVRQIIGWREFIRGVYEYKGSEERTKNYWGFTKKIPPAFYDGTTGIVPLDLTIKKVLETGYCHHIERLMVLGNFMLLCEFDPDEVYRWFMELFIDAYDWVMVPNVYGMSQFADGGLMATKPYISGSNYLLKMSNYPKGEWQEIWDALFWRFMHTYRDFFQKNPRLNMLIKNFDKRTSEQRTQLLTTAEKYLKSL